MALQKAFYKLTHWETWHYLAKYIPIFPVWAWYCIRARTPWFFTPSNPTLTFGGFEGETKMEMYKQLPPGTYPATVLVEKNFSFNEVQSAVAAAGLTYPFAVKPDAGMMGFMFRTMHNAEELADYHQKMPCNYVMQQLAPYPMEVSVFYYRFPGEVKGHITGFIKKEFLQVTGDGVRTLNQLIDAYQRASFRLDEVKSKHASRLGEIIKKDEPYILSYALNLSRGGRLVSLESEKDEKLLNVFDEISNYSKHFYYGRYDIKCASVESLKNGQDFTILEYNGCGAEPHHIYGNGNNIFEAYSIILKHWKALYQISKINRSKGYEPWPLMRGRKFLKNAKAHFRVLKALDLATKV